MKNSLLASLWVLFSFLLLSCGNEKKKPESTTIPESESIQTEERAIDSSSSSPADAPKGNTYKSVGFTTSSTQIPIWEYDVYKSLPVRKREVEEDTLNLENLIHLINATKGGDTVKIELVKTESDTVFLKVLNAFILTQQMGTSGADAYLATTVFTLTELSKFKYIYFDFPEGDHAIPGTYDRAYFYERYEEFVDLNRNH